MQAIHLLAVGGIPTGLLDRLSAGLARALRVSCRVEKAVLDPGFAVDTERGQYYSTAILARLAATNPPPGHRILGVTLLDLYVPILTFVYGEAQISGPCALVSAHRLREEYYGLPENSARCDQRLLIEALHELGHTQGLRHCSDWSCAMASSHSIESLDLKETRYCDACAAKILMARV